MTKFLICFEYEIICQYSASIIDRMPLMRGFFLLENFNLCKSVPIAVKVGTIMIRESLQSATISLVMVISAPADSDSIVDPVSTSFNQILRKHNIL
jgi:hypothetical protein